MRRSSLHSNMFLLIQVKQLRENGELMPLHSNMFLLIRPIVRIII